MTDGTCGGRLVVGLSGSLSARSRTTALVSAAASGAAHRFGLRAQVLAMPDFLPSLGLAQSIADLDPVARARLDTLLGAEALVIGTPVYKGSYTGLFKHLFDLIDPPDLAGKPVLLVATGGGEKHALVIEHQLRPLFGFFEAATLPTGVYATDTDCVAGALQSGAVEERLERAIEQFGPFLSRSGQPRAATDDPAQRRVELAHRKAT